MNIAVRVVLWATGFILFGLVLQYINGLRPIVLVLVLLVVVMAIGRLR